MWFSFVSRGIRFFAIFEKCRWPDEAVLSMFLCSSCSWPSPWWLLVTFECLPEKDPLHCWNQTCYKHFVFLWEFAENRRLRWWWGHGYMQELYNWFFCSSALNTPLVCIFLLTMVAKHQRLSKKDAVWKVKNSRLCVKPDIHSYPQFLTRIVTASVIFPSTSVCTGVCQHTVSGTMTKMAAYSELDWYVWSSIAQHHQSQMYLKSMIKL